MANRPAAPLAMTPEQQRQLEVIARSTSRPHREVRHAKALLMAVDGVANIEIAQRVGVGGGSVLAWRARFEVVGSSASGRWPRAGKPTIPKDKVEAIVHDTLHVALQYSAYDQVLSDGLTITFHPPA